MLEGVKVRGLLTEEHLRQVKGSFRHILNNVSYLLSMPRKDLMLADKIAILRDSQSSPI